MYKSHGQASKKKSKTSEATCSISIKSGANGLSVSLVDQRPADQSTLKRVAACLAFADGIQGVVDTTRCGRPETRHEKKPCFFEDPVIPVSRQKAHDAPSLEDMTAIQPLPPSEIDGGPQFRARLNRAERTFFDKMEASERDIIVKEAERIVNRRSDMPLLFRVLRSNLPEDTKLRMVQKLEKYNESLGTSDSVKFTTWTEAMLSLPLNEFCGPRPFTAEDCVGIRLVRNFKKLDAVIYGHVRAKQALIECTSQWYADVLQKTRALCLVGCPGNGKTTLIREGLSSVMERPVSFVPLGGCTDAAFLLGHGYTYEGSMAGKLAECVTTAKCMNPIILMDELDKISQSVKGDEISNVLMALTDPTQNDQIRDKYLHGIDLDMSRCLIVFTMNDVSKIPAVLRDRIQIIETDCFDTQSKKEIVKSYLFGKTMKNHGLDESGARLSEECIDRLITEDADKEGGVRTLQKRLERMVKRYVIWREVRDVPDHVHLLSPFNAECFCVSEDGVVVFTEKCAAASLELDKTEEDRTSHWRSLYS